MRRLWVLALSVLLVIGTSGCGKKKHDASAENGVSDNTQADTANVDSADSAEPPAPKADDVSNASPDTAASPDATASSDETASSIDDTSPPAQGSGETATYTVQKGDTLMKIAFNLYGDIDQWKNLYDLNKDKLKKASFLTEGMKLQYNKPASDPVIDHNGDPYLIKQGDTLGTIADSIYAKKSKWKKLWENNKSLIKDPNKIYAGFYLYYQITEEEKKEADEIRAKRANGQLGAVGNPNDAADAVANVNPASSQIHPASDPVAASQGTGGGLESLAAPSKGRAPASVNQ